MTFASQLIHTVDIARPSHDKVGKVKVLGYDSVATGVACRIEPAGDSPTTTLLGIGVAQSRRIFLMDDADIEAGDLVVASTGETMIVRSRERYYSSGAHHIQAMAEVRDA